MRHPRQIVQPPGSQPGGFSFQMLPVGRPPQLSAGARLMPPPLRPQRGTPLGDRDRADRKTRAAPRRILGARSPVQSRARARRLRPPAGTRRGEPPVAVGRHRTRHEFGIVQADGGHGDGLSGTCGWKASRQVRRSESTPPGPPCASRRGFFSLDPTRTPTGIGRRRHRLHRAQDLAASAQASSGEHTAAKERPSSATLAGWPNAAGQARRHTRQRHGIIRWRAA